MPTSDAEGKDWSLSWFKYHLPNTVTDVGPGEGTYAKLFRPVHEGVWWTGIEAHRPYIQRFKLKSTKTRRMYDEIHIEDVRESEDHLFHRDLVIFGDVLEHVERDDAVVLLERTVAVGAWNILVSVPIVDSPQGEVDGNPHEAHLHQWEPDDMDAVMAGLGGRVESMRGVDARVLVVEPGMSRYDNGGWLEPGWTIARNTSGRPEPVIRPNT